MTTNKKTLYEVLEVSPNASDSEIEAAYQRLSQNLLSKKTGLNHEDIDFKLKVINVAFHTLSVPRIRDAYDARLAALNMPAIVAAPSNVDAMSIKADAVSLKADAMALKADAVMLKADAMSLMLTDAPLKIEDGNKSHLSVFIAFITSLASPFKKILLFIGSLIATAMVLQVLFMLFVNRQVVDEASKAEEKLMIQEYYQEHGVRPGSKIEADLLETENRRKENEEREAEQEKKRQDYEYQRFVEESRQIGAQAADHLRREEETARYEEEQRKQQFEQEMREKRESELEAERIRIEAERLHRESELKRLGVE